ncbi:hypothetical protein [Streptomyces sp. NPDC101206]|uniref:hypothetical protein n=1 Tax=Streptomyces sp. NPDC101206 TaxID=3366128 RepID=UPI00381AE308
MGYDPVHTDEVRRITAEGGAAEELAAALLRASFRRQFNYRDDLVAQALADLCAHPAPARRRVRDALAGHFRTADADTESRRHLLALVALIGRGLSGEVLVAERRRQLDTVGVWWRTSYSAWEQALVDGELAAGRNLAPVVVATLRRSHLSPYYSEGLAAVVPKLAGPVLNVGEAWADRALADGERWQPLLAHAMTATAVRPSARWERTARSLCDAIGAGPVREQVLGWLDLVGTPRTVPLVEEGGYEPDANAMWDPHNATALRGLAWTLAVLPPHPDSVPALGRLAEAALCRLEGHGALSPRVAGACVTALARTDGEPALAELSRLAGRVTHKPTRKLLDAALESRTASR